MPYIFTVRADSGRTGRDVIAERFEQGFWPLNEKTPHQSDLSGGDEVLLYVAGASDPDAHCFVAIAEVAGRRIPSETRLVGPSWLGTARKTLYDLPVARLRWLDPPVAAKPLRYELKFIRKPERWGNYLQGGVIRIDPDDYSRVLRGVERSDQPA